MPALARGTTQRPPPPLLDEQSTFPEGGLEATTKPAARNATKFKGTGKATSLHRNSRKRGGEKKKEVDVEGVKAIT